MIEFDEFWEGYVKEGTHVNEWKAAKAAWQACKEALAQTQWVGLSHDDFNDASWFTDEFIEGANWAQNKLKELNT